MVATVAQPATLDSKSIAQIIVDAFYRNGVPEYAGFAVGTSIREGLNSAYSSWSDPSSNCPSAQSHGIFSLNDCGLAPLFYQEGYTNILDPYQQADFTAKYIAKNRSFQPWRGADALLTAGLDPFNAVWGHVVDAIKSPTSLWGDINKWIPSPLNPIPGSGLSPIDIIGSITGHLPAPLSGIQTATQAAGALTATTLKAATWLTQARNWWRLGIAVTGITLMIVGFISYVAGEQVTTVAVGAVKGPVGALIAKQRQPVKE